jgi:hypothetical protein
MKRERDQGHVPPVGKESLQEEEERTAHNPSAESDGDGTTRSDPVMLPDQPLGFGLQIPPEVFFAE